MKSLYPWKEEISSPSPCQRNWTGLMLIKVFDLKIDRSGHLLTRLGLVRSMRRRKPSSLGNCTWPIIFMKSVRVSARKNAFVWYSVLTNNFSLRSCSFDEKKKTTLVEYIRLLFVFAMVFRNWQKISKSNVDQEICTFWRWLAVAEEVLSVILSSWAVVDRCPNL